MKVHARRSSLLLFSLGMLGGGGACRGGGDAKPKTRPVPMVVTLAVGTRDVPLEVKAPVDLRPLVQVDVGSKTLGYLDAVLVDRGDRVRKGQLLALVRPSDLPDQLSAAKGSFAQAQASASLARTNHERAKALAPAGVVSQQELQQAASAVATSEAQEAATRAQIASWAVKLGETRIVSPINGYVAQRRLDPGALVGTAAGAAIMTLVQTDVLRVFITVNERDVRAIRLGQMARIELDAAPKPVWGKVVRLAPALDPLTRTMEAEVQFENPGDELRPGMYGRGAIVTEVHKNAVWAPVSGVQISGGNAFVFVVNGDTVARRPITTGVDGGEWLEVTSGLNAGDEIVIAGLDGLSDRAKVKPVRGVDPFRGGQAGAGPASNGAGPAAGAGPASGAADSTGGGRAPGAAPPSGGVQGAAAAK